MSGPHNWRHRFQGYAYHWTLPREAILELLSRTSKHMSAKEIYAYLLTKYPEIGLSTVYRTLNLLSQMGLINKLDIGEGQSRYEYRSGEEKAHHHHLICTKCGKIIDYSEFIDEELKLVKEAEKNIAGRYSFLVRDHNIEFYGLCEDCQ